VDGHAVCSLRMCGGMVYGATVRGGVFAHVLGRIGVQHAPPREVPLQRLVMYGEDDELRVC